jgi:hypothetical protein
MQQPPNVHGAAYPYPNNPINQNGTYAPPQPYGLYDNNEPENRKVKSVDQVLVIEHQVLHNRRYTS